jgi:hypothetical protein
MIRTIKNFPKRVYRLVLAVATKYVIREVTGYLYRIKMNASPQKAKNIILNLKQ